MEQEPKREPMSKAIASLEKTLEEIDEQHARDRAELLRAIENLKKLKPSEGKKGRARNGNGNHALGVANGRWRGMSIRDSVQAFLSNFDEPVPFDTLMTALRAGGVEMGDPAKPNRYVANVKTTVINNRKWFRYNKRKDTVELVVAAGAN